MSGERYFLKGKVLKWTCSKLTATLMKSFYLVLLTAIIIVVSAGETSSKCRKSPKCGKINKKLAGGKTAANDTYKYAVRMHLHHNDTHMSQCSGAFVSFSASNPTKCGDRPTKYFFITAGHCFDVSLQIKDIHYGLSKKSPFFTVRGGTAELEFEQLRNKLPINDTSEPNPFLKHIVVNTAVNIIRIPKEYHLNGVGNNYEVMRADVAFMELSKLQYDQIVDKGGEFVRGETNAYEVDRSQLDDCWIVSMGSIAQFVGTQLAAINQNKFCQMQSGIECWMLPMRFTKTGKFVTYGEHGDSGSPFVCKKGQNEHLMAVASEVASKNLPFVIYSPQRENLRDWLEKAYYDDTVYNYFPPPDNTSTVFIATEQAGYTRDELKR